MDFIKNIPEEIIAFFISMLPILELRGGLAYTAIQKIPYVQAILICLAGNILPMPFILLFLEKIFRFLEKFSFTRKIVTALERRARSKEDKIKKYYHLGLFFFVAIPLPGTGGWTGALIAVVLGLDRKKSFFTIMLGILTAGAIMSVLCYMLPDLYTKLIG